MHDRRRRVRPFTARGSYVVTAGDLVDCALLAEVAAGDDTTTWTGMTAGADVYLEKPFDHLGLLSWIDRLLVLDCPAALPVAI